MGPEAGGHDSMSGSQPTVVVLARERASRKLRDAVDQASGFDLAGFFSKMEKAVPAILEAPPKVILFELDLPGVVDIESVVHSLKRECSGVHVVVVCDVRDPRLVPALRAGAVGHLTRRAEVEDVERALGLVMAGHAALSPPAARHVVGHLQARAPTPTPPPYTYDLTGREREILESLIEGKSDALAAERLQISPHTVRAHIKSLYRKLSVSSRAAAVAKALREELV